MHGRFILWGLLSGAILLSIISIIYIGEDMRISFISAGISLFLFVIYLGVFGVLKNKR